MILESLTWTVLNEPGVAPVTLRAGVDRVNLEDFRHTVAAAGQSFLDRIFTKDELSFCARRVERLADRFAAKEAVAKVLGCGFRGIAPSEIEVVTAPNGEPRIVLHNRADDRAREIRLTSLAISMTNTTTCAEAFAVGLCASQPNELSRRKEIEHD